LTLLTLVGVAPRLSSACELRSRRASNWARVAVHRGGRFRPLGSTSSGRTRNPRLCSRCSSPVPRSKRHPQPLLDYLRLSMRQPVAGCPVIHFLYVDANSRARGGLKMDSPAVIVLRIADSTSKPSRRWPLPVRHQVTHGRPWSALERHQVAWVDRPSPLRESDAHDALAEGRHVRTWRVAGGSRISPRSWRNWMRSPYRIRDCGFSRRGLAPGPTRRYSSTCTPLCRT
jgi:hypothetical protein